MPRVKPRGYTDCPCRDCFEIAIDGDLCNLCEEAGCDASGGSECSCEPEDEGVHSFVIGFEEVES